MPPTGKRDRATDEDQSFKQRRPAFERGGQRSTLRRLTGAGAREREREREMGITRTLYVGQLPASISLQSVRPPLVVYDHRHYCYHCHYRIKYPSANQTTENNGPSSARQGGMKAALSRHLPVCWTGTDQIKLCTITACRLTLRPLVSQETTGLAGHKRMRGPD